MALLKALTGGDSIDLEELPSTIARKAALPADDSIEAAGTFEAKNIGTMERYFVTK